MKNAYRNEIIEESIKAQRATYHQALELCIALNFSTNKVAFQKAVAETKKQLNLLNQALQKKLNQTELEKRSLSGYSQEIAEYNALLKRSFFSSGKFEQYCREASTLMARLQQQTVYGKGKFSRQQENQRSKAYLNMQLSLCYEALGCSEGEQEFSQKLRTEVSAIIASRPLGNENKALSDIYLTAPDVGQQKPRKTKSFFQPNEPNMADKMGQQIAQARGFTDLFNNVVNAFVDLSSCKCLVGGGFVEIDLNEPQISLPVNDKQQTLSASQGVKNLMTALDKLAEFCSGYIATIPFLNAKDKAYNQYVTTQIISQPPLTLREETLRSACTAMLQQIVKKSISQFKNLYDAVTSNNIKTLFDFERLNFYCDDPRFNHLGCLAAGQLSKLIETFSCAAETTAKEYIKKHPFRSRWYGLKIASVEKKKQLMQRPTGDEKYDHLRDEAINILAPSLSRMTADSEQEEKLRQRLVM